MPESHPPGPRKLQVMGLRQASLGAPTIMDRALADQYGAPYVHLAVFAIDVDRVRAFHEGLGAAPLPFAWEVFLTERYVIERIDPEDPDQLSLLEDVCLSVLDEAPGQDRFGEQIPFAVYDAIERGALPDTLGSVFHGWRNKPRALLKDLARLWSEADVQTRTLAQVCLRTPLQPPAAPPSMGAFRALAGEETV